MLKNQLLIVAVILITITTSKAQQSKNIYHDNFVWTQYIWKGQLSDKVSIHTDLGYRTHDYYKSKAQYFIRVGAIYQISPKVNIQAGYAYFSTNQFLSGYEEVMRPEHRLYQRLTVVQQAGRVEIRNRYRLEERFNANISKGVIQDGYTESFRVGYQIYVTVPFNNEKVKENTVFGVVSDELFVSFGKKVYNNFDQNRFAAGIGYQFTKNFGATVFYQYIYGQQPTGTQLYSYNAYCVSLTQTVDFRKKDK
jgi:hypothetical protein